MPEEIIKSAYILQHKRNPNGFWEQMSKRDFGSGLSGELAAEEKFNELTSGGFVESNASTLYRWEFIVVHRDMGRLVKRKLYTID